MNQPRILFKFFAFSAFHFNLKIATNQILNDIDAELNHFNVLYPNTFDNTTSQYYNSNSFHLAFPDIAPTDFKVIHINIRSIAAHGEELDGYLKTLNTRFEAVCIRDGPKYRYR